MIDILRRCANDRRCSKHDLHPKTGWKINSFGRAVYDLQSRNKNIGTRHASVSQYSTMARDEHAILMCQVSGEHESFSLQPSSSGSGTCVEVIQFSIVAWPTPASGTSLPFPFLSFRLTTKHNTRP